MVVDCHMFPWRYFPYVSMEPVALISMQLKIKQNRHDYTKFYMCIHYNLHWFNLLDSQFPITKNAYIRMYATGEVSFWAWVPKFCITYVRMYSQILYVSLPVCASIVILSSPSEPPTYVIFEQHFIVTVPCQTPIYIELLS